MAIEHLTTQNFDETIKSATKPVLVDFYAQWCGPCKMIAPVLEEISAENDDFIIYKVNVDEANEVAQKYGVANIPTLISFKDGEILNKNVGALPKDKIIELVK